MSATHQDIEAARQELRLRQEEGRELGLDNLSPETLESTAEGRDPDPIGGNPTGARGGIPGRQRTGSHGWRKPVGGESAVATLLTLYQWLRLKWITVIHFKQEEVTP